MSVASGELKATRRTPISSEALPMITSRSTISTSAGGRRDFTGGRMSGLDGPQTAEEPPLASMEARFVSAGTYAAIAVSMAVLAGVGGFVAGRGTADVD